jgi:hypothetical protein
MALIENYDRANDMQCHWQTEDRDDNIALGVGD